MTSIKSYKRSTVIERIETVLNQINQRYFEGNHGILLVTDSGSYVTIHNRTGNQYFDVQGIFDALNSFSLDSFDDQEHYDIWDYLDFCKYTPEDQQSDDQLKIDKELSFSEKQQVALVDMLLSEPESSGTDDWTVSLIPQSPIHTEASTLSELVEELEQENKRLKESREFWRKLAFSGEDKYQECLKYIASEKAHLNNCIKQLQEEYQELEKNKEYSQAWVDNLKQRVHDLECAVHLLQQENKQLKNQSETKPEHQPEPKPEKTLAANKGKKSKFKLPENFADYQQECDDLINGLSSFYNIKKGKWNGNILQFILTPTDAEKESQLYPYPNKWKAGLYLHCGYWSMDKVNLSDPDDWEDWFMNIYDFADSNDIEIS